MRKLALLTLASYLLFSFAIFSPLTFADDDKDAYDAFIDSVGEEKSEDSGEDGLDMSEDDMSSYSLPSSTDAPPADNNYTVVNPTCSFSPGSYQIAQDSSTEQAEENLAQYLEEFEKNLKEDTTACGAINGVTNYYEKGDCTEAGWVITEVTEPIGGNTEVLDSNGEYTNKVLTVYKGVCCFIPERNYLEQITGCKETRTIYADTYAKCTGTTSNPTAAHCEKRQWIMGTSGAGIIKVYVKLIYGWAAGLIGFIAVAVIVVSGIQITMSGVSGDITSAKDRIIQSISALVLLFLSGLILYTINPTFFG